MKLLVPLHRFSEFTKGLRFALKLASEHRDAILILLNVQTAETLGLSEIRARSDREIKLARRKSNAILRRAVSACEQRQLVFETRTEFDGPIAETIDRVARETGADQIIMGARGLGRLRGLLLGSVATQVIHLANIPITLVKADASVP